MKLFVENTFYHAYNRGSNKQTIFHDEHDYRTFLYLFKRYLEPGFMERKFTPRGEAYFTEPHHLYKEIDLVAFCLMPNHFHLLVFQKTERGMPKLLSCLSSNYATYYNQKYGREGSPFQDTYKAVMVRSEEQLLHLSRYIHLNPVEVAGREGLKNYQPSSYVSYMDAPTPTWLKPESVLVRFGEKLSYLDFVESYLKLNEHEKEKEREEIADLMID